MNNSIYRKKALDKAASIDLLDRAMKVTSPLSWMVLLGCLALIVTVGLWAVFGEICTVVQGNGMIVEYGTIFDVVPLYDGQIIRMDADLDDKIKKGQVVAYLNQPEMENELVDRLKQLKLLFEQRKMIVNVGNEIYKTTNVHINKRRDAIADTLARSQKRLDELQAVIEGYAALATEGHITKAEYLDKLRSYDGLLQAVMNYKEQLADLPISTAQATYDNKVRVQDIDFSIAQAQGKIAALTDQIKIASEVVAPKSGKVVELIEGLGDFVRAGEPVLRLELHTPKDIFRVLTLFPAGDGKRIRPGMQMQVIPSTVKREEYGSIIAKVKYITDFPVSRKYVMHYVQNEKLANDLTVAGPTIGVRAILEKDKATATGFKWTSGKGPDVVIQTGTLCRAEVIVERQPPIELLLPQLRKIFLGVGEYNTKSSFF